MFTYGVPTGKHPILHIICSLYYNPFEVYFATRMIPFVPIKCFLEYISGMQAGGFLDGYEKQNQRAYGGARLDDI